MSTRHRIRLPLYLVPIMFGLCGILISSQFVDDPVVRSLVILFSVSVPLFAVGMLVARLNVSGAQRAALFVGVLLLAVGALVSVALLGDQVIQPPLDSPMPPWAKQVGRWLGISSLIVGLFAIVFILSRREEQIEVIGEQFRYLADHMTEGFILTGADGTITLVNDALLKMTGLPADELIGKSEGELAERYKLDPLLSRVAHRSQGVASEYRLPWVRDGKELQLWINGTPLFDSRGRFAGSLATIRDVTEQHQMSKRLERYAQGLQDLVEDRTEKLYQSRQRLQDLLFHMNEAFVTLDREYRITFANERFCDLVGIADADSVLRRDLFEFVESSDRGRMLELFPPRGSSEVKRPPHELTLRTVAGAPLHVVASTAAVEPAPDAEDRYSLVMTDIGELKRMQRQLEARAAELEEANAELRMLDRAKDNFLSTVSHELRTPLSTVRGYTEMLESGTLGELQAQQANSLKVMSRNLERLGGLIDEIIEFSRMQVRGVVLHQTLFSGEKFLAECAASLAPQAQLRDLHIRVHASPDAALLWGDRHRLIQAMTILLSNSVKFCNPGDIITLTSERRAGGIIAIGVSDTGIGIDPSVQRRVFDKFYQADNSRSRRYEGAGIGLAIAKAIAEAHGGHIDLQSAPGKGSTFTIILTQASFAAADPGDLPTVASEKRILLAVADGEFAAGLRGVLESAGLSVSVVTTGMACIRAANQDAPGIILMDDLLPDIGGVEAIARLQDGGSLENVSVLLMAGDDLLPGRDDPNIQSVASYLMKPFTAEELLVALSHTLNIPVQQPSRTLRKKLRKASTPTALVLSTDRELLDWAGSALRARQMRCVAVQSPEEARDAATKHNIQAVAVEADTAESATLDFLHCAREIASEHGAQLTILKSDEDSGSRVDGERVIGLPCTARELAEALSISGEVVA
ncbi:MAG: PAS domain S-box protein [Candidatus Hydrogenedentes bacterium]|nr:PAS domain S-box protein [Candidatus Hydrogenedentota bacterium]